MGDMEKRAVEESLKLKKLIETATAQLKSRTDYLKQSARDWAFNKETPPASSIEAGEASISVSDKYATNKLVELDALKEIDKLDTDKYFRVKQLVQIDIDLIPESKQHDFSVMFKGLLNDESCPKEAVKEINRVVHEPAFHSDRFSWGKEVNEDIQRVYKMGMSVTFPKASYANLEIFDGMDVIMDAEKGASHHVTAGAESDVSVSA